jgi:hypothetical protein
MFRLLRSARRWRAVNRLRSTVFRPLLDRTEANVSRTKKKIDKTLQVRAPLGFGARLTAINSLSLVHRWAGLVDA